jgi:hypothetical protein
VTPKNVTGRFVGVLVMLQGIAFLAIVTAAITSTFVARAAAECSAHEQEHDDLIDDRLDARLVELSQRLDRVEQLLLKLTKE